MIDTVNQSPFHVVSFWPGGDGRLWSYYPILPWLELVIFGQLFGRWLVDDPRKAFSRAWKLGLLFLLLFFPIRTWDGFGNIRPRVSDHWIDYLNPVKYPPSMTFTLLTTSANLLLLWTFAKAGDRVQKWLAPLTVFGQTPLLFYMLHLFLYALIANLFTPEGTSLLAMYPVWLAGLAILFPLCWWYGRFKRRQPVGSIARFL
jgi:uncharacterized membrane protein